MSRLHVACIMNGGDRASFVGLGRGPLRFNWLLFIFKERESDKILLFRLGATVMSWFWFAINGTGGGCEHRGLKVIDLIHEGEQFFGDGSDVEDWGLFDLFLEKSTSSISEAVLPFLTTFILAIFLSKYNSYLLQVILIQFLTHTFYKIISHHNLYIAVTCLMSRLKPYGQGEPSPISRLNISSPTNYSANSDASANT